LQNHAHARLHSPVSVIALKSPDARARDTGAAMKRPAQNLNPLEETMENPDLPPLAAVSGASAPAAARPARRGLRVTLLLLAFLVAAVVVVRLVA
jgi:hypothetical protein